MKTTVFFFTALVACGLNVKQTCSLQVDSMDFKTRIDVEDPSWNFFSAGILKSHMGLHYEPGKSKILTLSAPKGCSIFAAFRLLDLRPMNEDVLTLSAADYSVRPFTYSNGHSSQNKIEDHTEQLYTFFVKNGQMVVTFTTGPNYYTNGYGGFELIYTSQTNYSMCKSNYFHCTNKRCIANTLKCDGHNHCGDRSEQENCHADNIYPARRSHAGLIAGVVFLLIAAICVIFIVVRRGLRSRVETQTGINNPPPTNLPGYPPSYQEPGTYYPPPPPPYSPYDQGKTNPGYH